MHSPTGPLLRRLSGPDTRNNTSSATAVPTCLQAAPTLQKQGWTGSLHGLLRQRSCTALGLVWVIWTIIRGMRHKCQQWMVTAKDKAAKDRKEQREEEGRSEAKAREQKRMKWKGDCIKRLRNYCNFKSTLIDGGWGGLLVLPFESTG